MTDNALVQNINEADRVLYILCGLPYAGKSHLVNELLKQTTIEVVSIDRIFAAKGFDWDTQNLPNETEWSAIFAESYEAVQAVLKTGRNVLYDSTNQTKASRDKLRGVATSVGASTRVVYVKTPTEIIWKRWEENRLTPTRPQIRRQLVKMTIDSFEEPDESEKVFIIST